MSAGDAPLQWARALVAGDRRAEAEDLLAATVAETFDLPVARVAVNRDVYSLNSLNGMVQLTDGRAYFFKFHQEEDEGTAVEEYYRAELLERAGFPVDRPAFVSQTVGRQMLLYPLRQDRRMADVCRDIELSGDFSNMQPVLDAQARLDNLTCQRYRATLRTDLADASVREPIHQLFHRRLADLGRPEGLGARVARFYLNERFEFPGTRLNWTQLAGLRWRINGVSHAHTLGDLFDEARVRLAPERLAGCGQVTAHGDAHNANVWYTDKAEGAGNLVLFDPAFAGAAVPSLLAEVKATFHNVFAHPFLLYDPAIADQRFTAHAAVRDGVLQVSHDWTLSPLRRAFLATKLDRLWRPWLAELNARGLLPDDWARIVRLALFCCPTLVMNLRAGGGQHTPTSSLLCLCAAIACASPPLEGPDPLARLVPAAA
jgi:hypothetical protein